MRSVLKLVFGTEAHNLAVQAAVVVGAVIHESYYLDNTYLNSGNNPPTNLKNQYGIYSESYNEVDTTSWDDNTIREIYEHEVFCVAKSGCYCGMWQFYQAANVIS